MNEANYARWLVTLVALLATGVGCSDRIDGPDSIAEATQQEPVASSHPGRPGAQWKQPGSTVTVTLYGSGTCPPVPVAIDVEVDESRIALTVSEHYELSEGEGCTDDMAATTYVVRLPERLNPSQPAALIVQEDGKRDVRIRLRESSVVS